MATPVTERRQYREARRHSLSRRPTDYTSFWREEPLSPDVSPLLRRQLGFESLAFRLMQDDGNQVIFLGHPENVRPEAVDPRQNPTHTAQGLIRIDAHGKAYAGLHDGAIVTATYNRDGELDRARVSISPDQYSWVQAKSETLIGTNDFNPHFSELFTYHFYPNPRPADAGAPIPVGMVMATNHAEFLRIVKNPDHVLFGTRTPNGLAGDTPHVAARTLGFTADILEQPMGRKTQEVVVVTFPQALGGRQTVLPTTL